MSNIVFLLATIVMLACTAVSTMPGESPTSALKSSTATSIQQGDDGWLYFTNEAGSFFSFSEGSRERISIGNTTDVPNANGISSCAGSYFAGAKIYVPVVHSNGCRTTGEACLKVFTFMNSEVEAGATMLGRTPALSFGYVPTNNNWNTAVVRASAIAPDGRRMFFAVSNSSCLLQADTYSDLNDPTLFAGLCNIPAKDGAPTDGSGSDARFSSDIRAIVSYRPPPDELPQPHMDIMFVADGSLIRRIKQGTVSTIYKIAEGTPRSLASFEHCMFVSLGSSGIELLYFADVYTTADPFANRIIPRKAAVGTATKTGIFIYATESGDLGSVIIPGACRSSDKTQSDIDGLILIPEGPYVASPATPKPTPEPQTAAPTTPNPTAPEGTPSPQSSSNNSSHTSQRKKHQAIFIAVGALIAVAVMCAVVVAVYISRRARLASSLHTAAAPPASAAEPAAVIEPEPEKEGTYDVDSSEMHTIDVRDPVRRPPERNQGTLQPPPPVDMHPSTGDSSTTKSAASATRKNGRSVSLTSPLGADSQSSQSPSTRRPATALLRKKANAQFHFKKGRCIGAGGFGRVYLGLDEDTGTMLACKEIIIGTNRSVERAVKLLDKEINIMQKLQHENVVSYVGAERRGTNFYILMEYVPGGTLRGIIDDFGAMKYALAAEYTRQILQGLAYIHGKDIVHRDIKAANILIDIDGVAKISDFGASRHFDTVTGVSGTPYWMAPEVVRSDASASWPSDIWSLGCTVIEMATGGIPFQSMGSVYWVMQLLDTTEGEVPLPDALRGVPADFVRACLQRDVTKRPTAEELLQHPFVVDDLGHDRSASPQQHVHRVSAEQSPLEIGMSVAPSPEEMRTRNQQEQPQVFTISSQPSVGNGDEAPPNELAAFILDSAGGALSLLEERQSYRQIGSQYAKQLMANTLKTFEDQINGEVELSAEGDETHTSDFSSTEGEVPNSSTHARDALQQNQSLMNSRLSNRKGEEPLSRTELLEAALQLGFDTE